MERGCRGDRATRIVHQGSKKNSGVVAFCENQCVYAVAESINDIECRPTGACGQCDNSCGRRVTAHIRNCCLNALATKTAAIYRDDSDIVVSKCAQVA